MKNIQLVCNIEQFFQWKINNEKFVLIDVRSREERFIDGFISEDDLLIPLEILYENFEQIKTDKNTKIIVYCHSGVRSYYAVQFLLEKGFDNIFSLEGGILGYKKFII